MTRFPATMGLSDSRIGPSPGLCLSLGRWGWWPRPTGSPRFLDRSVRARCPLSPRRVRQVLALVASPPMAGFSLFGSLATVIWCNEAEPGSLALRLARWPPEASPAGSLRRALGWLLVERAINKVNTSQLTRSARLGLALRNTRTTRKMMERWREREMEREPVAGSPLRPLSPALSLPLVSWVWRVSWAGLRSYKEKVVETNSERPAFANLLNMQAAALVAFKCLFNQASQIQSGADVIAHSHQRISQPVSAGPLLEQGSESAPLPHGRPSPGDKLVEGFVDVGRLCSICGCDLRR
jgi:hypothetical protein